MPRKFLRRYLPDRNRVYANRLLKRLETYLDQPRLWHLNRHSVAGAAAWGTFVAFLPIPFQMVVVSLGAIGFRVNLPLSLALIFITNPFTMGPAYYFCYRLGAWLTGTPALAFAAEQPLLPQLLDELSRIWLPLWAGSLIAGGVLAITIYTLVRLGWRIHVLGKRGRLARRLANRRDRRRVS
jgi:uncharacterized protein (DUF2062 family)